MTSVTLEHARAATWVWLDRPERHNAFDARLIADLHAAFDEAAAGDARCVVLAGRGRSFSAGADVEWMRASGELDREQNVADAERMAALLQAIDSCPKPVVARVHGAALGGGAGLVACSDVALATAVARFAFSEVRLGLIPATISPYVLAKIGPSQARALFLGGRRFDAAEAHRIGLVHEVHADEAALDDAVEAWIEVFRRCAPQAVAHAKRLLARVAGHDPGAVRRETAEAIAERRASAEGQEGLRAFLEKRTPSWAED
jgi:methylglutaconyl-CoA hydratase